MAEAPASDQRVSCGIIDSMNLPHLPADEQAGHPQLGVRALAATHSTLVWTATAGGSVADRTPAWEAFTRPRYGVYAGWGAPILAGDEGRQWIGLCLDVNDSDRFTAALRAHP